MVRRKVTDVAGDPVCWSVHELVAEVARADPDAPAVRAGETVLTYGALVAAADALAAGLRRLGVGPDQVVAVRLPRSPDAVIAVLAVQQAGGAYLPLDPAEPLARSVQIIQDARAVLTLCLPEDVDDLATEGLQVLTTKASQPPPAAAVTHLRPAVADNLAYVIYTSGSTGAPKGVMVSRRSLAGFAAWNRTWLGLTGTDHTTLLASPGFDASVLEIWPTLTAGACLHVPDDETRLSPHRLRDWIVTSGITVAFLSTPLAELLLAQSWPTDTRLRVLQTGGDRLHAHPPPGLPFRLVNNYGPTESTVVATAGTVPDAATALAGAPLIGAAVEAVAIYLLDSQLRQVADGEPGEIFLGGAALARGYLHRPDLTAELFVPSPFGPAGARLYRTGDLARRMPDGQLEFRGRNDDQIKLRSNRIEPAEVSMVLRAHPALAAAHTATFLAASGEPALVCYLVPRSTRRLPDVEQVRSYLAGRLPSYLVPSEFILLDSLPLNRSGKVDRAALPAPRPAEPDPDHGHQAPATDSERKLAAIWSDVFGSNRVGMGDDFFALGGNSLTAARLVARVRDQLGVDVGVGTVFRHPTLAAFHKELTALSGRPAAEGLPSLQTVPRQSRMPLSFLQEQLFFLSKLSPGTVAYHAQATIRVGGPLQIPVLESALTEVVRRHEILHTVYEQVQGRPYQLVVEPQPVTVEVIDLQDVLPVQQEAQLTSLIADRMRQPFDLTQLPLMRWSAVQLAQQEWELILIEHHMVHDGWSMSHLTYEVTQLYNAYLAGLPSPLPDPPVHYLDFAMWQRQALTSPGMLARLAYWRDQLADPPPPLVIPTERPRPPALGSRGDRLRVGLPAELPDRLRALCRADGLSLFTVLLAGYVVLLSRLAGVTDMCIGSAFANRRFQDVEQVLGMFVNNVVLRCDASGDPSFRELLQRLQPTVLDAAAHQDVPFSQLVRELAPRREHGVTPFFQVMFSFHDSPAPALDFDGAPATLFEQHNGASKVDLDLAIIPRAERQVGGEAVQDSRITLLWDYHSDVFERVEVQRLADRYNRLLAAVVEDPDAPISRLPC